MKKSLTILESKILKKNNQIKQEKMEKALNRIIQTENLFFLT